MKTYAFRAGTPKDDRIMGFGYPATFMIPALLILLILSTVFPHGQITRRATLDHWTMIFILAPSFIIGSCLATRIKRKLGHDFKIQIENKAVTVWMDDEKVFADFLEAVLVKETAQMFRLSIYGVKNRIVLIGRDSKNAFGFCRQQDLSELKMLAADLRTVSAG